MASTKTVLITLRTNLARHGLEALTPGSTVYASIMVPGQGTWEGDAEIVSVSTHEVHDLPETRV